MKTTLVFEDSVFEKGTTLNALRSLAINVIDNILSCEHYQEPYSGKNHWNLVRSLSEETKATRKLVSDIQHVALTMEHGCT